MKYRKFLLLLITPLLMGVASKDTKAIQTIKLSSPSIGPFEQYQEDVATFYTLTSTYTKASLVYERILFTNISTGSERNVKTANHSVPARASTRVDLVIPTSEFMGPSGMAISISLYDGRDDSLIRSHRLAIYPAGKETINPIQYVDDGYTTKTIGIVFPSAQLKEKLTFNHYADYFLTDIYYRLPLEQFDFGIESTFKETPTGTGFMLIRNGKSLFPNLTSIGNNVNLTLKVTKVREIYRISIKNSLYVNPNTLLMSNNPIAGYVATDNFYFPINKMSRMQGLDVTFTLIGVGYNKTNLSWTCTYYPTSSIIGPCNNSEYCIEGGVSK